MILPAFPWHQSTTGRSPRAFNVPTEQPRPISSLKPDLFQRQATEPSPISILPGLGMIDEELVKDTDSGLLVESQ